MNRRVVIKLFDKTITKSKTGFETRNDTTGREVYAEQGGVGRSEFYKAAAVIPEEDYRLLLPGRTPD